MVTKTIEICGQPVRFCASAATPRLYRLKFKRDIFADMQKLTKDFQERNTSADLAVESLEIFENVAYIMAFQADRSIPDTIDAWLDQFEMFSIYEVLGELVQLWGDNLFTAASAKKKQPRSSREMTTPLYLLRCCDIGVQLADLDLLTIGLVYDMWTERGNDSVQYARTATQEDFDQF